MRTDREPALCPACGAAISAEPGGDRDTCPYCGASFLVPEALKAFRETYARIQGAGAALEAERHIVGFDIRSGVLRKYNGAAREVEIPAGVTEIGPEAFRGSDAVRVILGRNVRKIGDFAFAESRRLEQVEGLAFVSEIGAYAFYNCRHIKSLDLTGAEVLGEGALAGCTRLEEVIGCARLQRVPAYAFAGDTSLKELRLEGALQIGTSALAGCDNLRSLYVTGAAINTKEKSTGPDGWCSYTSTESRYFRPGRCPLLEEVYVDGSLLVLDERTGSAHSAIRRNLEGSGLADRYAKAVRWMSEGRCRYCGGQFTGLLHKSCSLCRHPKDY